jgi:hypothetical protein
MRKALTEDKSALTVCREQSRGRTENSPGPQSVVYYATATSPEGTAEMPGRQSWVDPERTVYCRRTSRKNSCSVSGHDFSRAVTSS